MLQHLPPTQVYKSKAWFAATLYNAEVRETAYYKIKEISDKKKAEEEKTKLTIVN